MVWVPNQSLLLPGAHQRRVQIDWSNPITRGLKGVFVGSQGPINLANGKLLVPTTLSGYTSWPSFNGNTASFAGNSILVQDVGAPSSLDWSVLAIARNISDTATTVPGGFGNNVNNFEREAWVSFPRISAPDFQYNCGGTSTNDVSVISTYTSYANNNQTVVVGGTSDSASTIHYLYINGIAVNSVTTSLGGGGYTSDMNLFCVGGDVDANSISAGTNAFNGEIDYVFAWHRTLSAWEMAVLAENPNAILKITEGTEGFLLATGGGGISQALPVVTETDSAQAFGKTKQYTLPIATETDTAITLIVAKQYSVSPAQETDTAISISWIKQYPLPVALETDTAQGFVVQKIYTLGTALETDTSITLVPAKQYSLPTATETDTALNFVTQKVYTLGIAQETDTAITIVLSAGGITIPLPVVTETDTAQVISVLKQYPLPIALETDTALGFNRSKEYTLVIANETESSIPFVVNKQYTLPTALETDTAIDITVFVPSISIPLPIATETDTALTLNSVKQYPLPTAGETDTALTITLSGAGALTPAEIQQILDALIRDPRFLAWLTILGDRFLR